jgi:hypothetical protein
MAQMVHGRLGGSGRRKMSGMPFNIKNQRKSVKLFGKIDV